MSGNVAKLDDGTEAHLKTGGEQITFANKTVAGSIDDECGKVFQLLKIRRKHRFIVYKIDAEKVYRASSVVDAPNFAATDPQSIRSMGGPRGKDS